MADDEVVEEWAQLFSIVAAFLRDCERNEDTIDVNFVEYVCERLARTISSIGIVNIAVTDASDPELKTQVSNLVNELTANVLPMWREKLYALERDCSSIRVQPSVRQDPSSYGRPPFQVDSEQILFLRELNFTWQSIANLLGVSRMTLYRKRKDAGILDSPRYVCSVPTVAKWDQII